MVLLPSRSGVAQASSGHLQRTFFVSTWDSTHLGPFQSFQILEDSSGSEHVQENQCLGVKPCNHIYIYTYNIYIYTPYIYIYTPYIKATGFRLRSRSPRDQVSFSPGAIGRCRQASRACPGQG